MIRPVFTELILFLIPFAAYAIFLAATRKGLLDAGSWPMGRIAWLAIAALAMMIGSFVGLAQFGGVPPGSTYTPAHVENGRLIPGRNQ
jgi:Family of unknown function (DUF6111)